MNNTQFVINQEEAGVKRERWLYFFKKTTLFIDDASQGFPIYLIRYSIFTCAWFAIKVHKIMANDDDCLHDHPWDFLSIILSGGYIEHRPKGIEYKKSHERNQRLIRSLGTFKRFYSPGSILWRPYPSIHKLELVNGKPATTLVITFKKKFDWGFYTPSGWLRPSQYTRSGSKCE